ncbi:hypothetical protein KM043_009574 [Ampulex compressa]|nr:hypothetical protein KM043_009574 [Ampulex compressa]
MQLGTSMFCIALLASQLFSLLTSHLTFTCEIHATEDRAEKSVELSEDTSFEYKKKNERINRSTCRILAERDGEMRRSFVPRGKSEGNALIREEKVGPSRLSCQTAKWQSYRAAAGTDEGGESKGETFGTSPRCAAGAAV